MTDYETSNDDKCNKDEIHMEDYFDEIQIHCICLIGYRSENLMLEL